MRVDEPLQASVAHEVVERVIVRAREAFGNHLRSVVLFGSAAEDRLRPSSDVNVIFVLDRFDRAAADQLRGELRLARAASRLDPMFLLSTEVDDAATAFAVKFDDLRRRRRVLYGDDPFSSLEIDHEAMRRRAIQVLLNLELRVRRSYALDGDHDEVLTRALADAAGPLRAAAATALELRGETVTSGRDALAAFAGATGDPALTELPERIRVARAARGPIEGAGDAVMAIGRLAALLRRTLQQNRAATEKAEP